MHIAQLNIARPLFHLEDERMAGFTNNIDKINAVAERSPGFIWRLKDEADNATNIAWPGEENAIVNMSIWETIEHLEHFVWNTVHRKLYMKKAQWFPKMEMAHFVMWHVDDGYEPTVLEAYERLMHFNNHGATDYAFGWEKLSNLKL